MEYQAKIISWTCYNRLHIELHVHVLDARNMGRMFKILLQYNP